MYNKKILFSISILILVSLACGFNFDLPVTTDIKTGPTVIDNISIENPDDPDAVTDITLAFGAGELKLSPGGDQLLVSGQATYNVDDLKPEITERDGTVKIETGNLEIDGFPNFTDRVINKWDYKFGPNTIDLSIKAGAYLGNFELGNLSLSNLHIADGASEVELNFSQPNRIQMSSFRYETGASKISLYNLANANFTTMIFESGAGDYELDFSGKLQRNTSVFIDSGLSSLTISVPETTNTKVNLEGGLTNIAVRGNWEQSGNMYSIPAEGPELTITIEMNAGNLTLNNP
jgi:hypothetical protein